MCLILLGWRVHPDYPLVVAANRDEFYRRPSAPASFWADAPDVLAGRDLEAGGTWLGITRQQRFAALTNYRDGLHPKAGTPSRGTLVADFLTGDPTPETFITDQQAQAENFNGFNLLIGDQHHMGYLTNRAPEGMSVRWLTPGVYGLSNHLLDTPWPKLSSAKKAFTNALAWLPDADPFMDLLADQEIVPDEHLPSTGIPLSWERVLSAIFVNSPEYGTRASTVLTRHRSGEISLIEKSFGRNAEELGIVRETFHSSEISTGV